jgi:hypothetical protein
MISCDSLSHNGNSYSCGCCEDEDDNAHNPEQPLVVLVVVVVLLVLLAQPPFHGETNLSVENEATSIAISIVGEHIAAAAIILGYHIIILDVSLSLKIEPFVSMHIYR